MEASREKSRDNRSMAANRKDHNSNIAENVDEKDIGVEDEAFDLKRGWTRKTEDPTQKFVTCADVQVVIAGDVRKRPACNQLTVLTELVKEKWKNVLKVWCNAAKEGVEALLFNLQGEAIVGIVQLEKM